MKSYTDLKQSKKLAEILPIESADMCYKCIEDDPYDIVCKPYSEWKEEYKGLLVRGDANVIPCWSLASLINLLPSEITVVGEYLTTQYNIRIRKHKLTDDTDVHQIAYGNYGSSGSWHDMINTSEKESLLDVTFEMICWLKNENYI